MYKKMKRENYRLSKSSSEYKPNWNLAALSWMAEYQMVKMRLKNYSRNPVHQISHAPNVLCIKSLYCAPDSLHQISYASNLYASNLPFIKSPHVPQISVHQISYAPNLKARKYSSKKYVKQTYESLKGKTRLNLKFNLKARAYLDLNSNFCG